MTIRERPDGFDVEVTGTVWEWRGPSPFYFLSLSPEDSDHIRRDADLLTYGWGAMPATLRHGTATWTTSIFLRGDVYVVPLKKVIREALGVGEGDAVTLHIALRFRDAHGHDG